MVHTVQDLIDQCSGKPVIAYGTGKIGKFVIPFLEGKINLKGVTNSWIAERDGGVFQGTELPIRSIREWQKCLPDAIILITTTGRLFQKDISAACRELGFQKILCIDEEMEEAMLAARIEELASPSNMGFIGRLLPKIEARLVDRICHANEIRDVHQKSFAEFRGCHRGRDVAVVASGPTLNYYSPIKGIPHIGVNTTFLRAGLALDYYFAQDCNRNAKWYDELKKQDFLKFFGLIGEFDQDRKILTRVPETLIEENHGRRYFTQEFEDYAHPDIEHYALMDYGSVVFAALHFALYTLPKRILLVGCDCTDGVYFEGMGAQSSHMVKGWEKAKRFIDIHYPGVEVVSVNPVNLKGLFRDVYTEPYLAEHPELDPEPSEIFRPSEYEAM